MSAVVITVLVLSVFHFVLGLISVCAGVTLSVSTEAQMDHHISPIWSGTLFIITGVLGLICAKMRTSYPIIWFAAINVASLVAAIISIQLLHGARRNSDKVQGQRSASDVSDMLVDLSLGGAGCECFICMASFIVICSMAKASKKELQRQREETFQIQEVDESSQEATPSNNDDEGYLDPELGRSPIADEERFTCVPCARQEQDNFLKTWNLGAEGPSFQQQLASDPDEVDRHNESRWRTSVTEQSTLDVRDTVVLDTEHCVERDGQTTDDFICPTVYTISSNVHLQTAEHTSDFSLDNHFQAEDDMRNEFFPNGEKPRLKRILSLIESECGASYPNSNNNAT